MTQSHRQRFTTAIKLLLIASLVAIAIAARSHIQAPLQASLLWVESLGSFRPLAFISIYNLATILFVPGSLLTMGGGAIFGLVWGTIYVTIAAILGATLAFILGRYFCRDFVKNKIGDRHKFQAINRAVAAEGLKIVLLTRLCPIFHSISRIISLVLLKLLSKIISSVL